MDITQVANGGEHASSIRSAVRQCIDLDLLLLDFHQAFSDNPQAAAERLIDLLLDPITCDARCAMLRVMTCSDAGQLLLPGASLTDKHEFLRECVWLSTGQLGHAIALGLASQDHLAQLASEADGLRLGQQALMRGSEAVDEFVRQHQVEAWNWLRDEIVSGRIVTHFGPDVIGQHIGIWRKEQPYNDFVIGNEPYSVKTAAAARWLVPLEMIAETFVDPI